MWRLYHADALRVLKVVLADPDEIRRAELFMAKRILMSMCLMIAALIVMPLLGNLVVVPVALLGLPDITILIALGIGCAALFIVMASICFDAFDFLMAARRLSHGEDIAAKARLSMHESALRRIDARRERTGR